MDKAYDVVLIVYRALNAILCLTCTITLLPMAIDDWKFYFRK